MTYGGTIDRGTGTNAPSADTRVVGRRVVQYIIDSIVSGLLMGLPWLLFLLVPWEPDGEPASGGAAVAVGAVALLLTVAIALAYWVFLPARSGRTLGMRLLGLRVVREDGEPVSAVTMLIRWVLLIVDGMAGGLVGLILIIATDRNQRLGDMAARTLVVRG
ncbi:RDD family protein [Allonocardiopsis opalescens]|uniref:Putative RDD family membrane protein YckC n=1 Tax=Allonocardiopsis opalescens TaxID=1144618 RepID=A0A2T0QE62_9ACTN|nr:RDD family protein [Allonocardiopsis opalescens]PRY02198.1 putative RDD family membrane protein YckC [Allonocardiopsis opalescens]